MSRIGKQPIPVPAGVDVKIDGSTVTVKGPKGELTRSFAEILTIKQEGEEILVERPDDTRESKSMHGLTRTLISNMVVGVSEGFSTLSDVESIFTSVFLWYSSSSSSASFTAL